VAILKKELNGDVTLDQTSDTVWGATTEETSISPAAGDYLCIFSAWVVYNTSPADEVLITSIYVNGSQVANSERQLEQEDSEQNGDGLIFLSAKITVAASEKVDIRYRQSAAKAMTGKRRSLILFPWTSGSDEVKNSDEIEAPTSGYADMTDMTLTPGAGDYLAVFSTHVNLIASNGVNIQFVEAGTALAHTERLVEAESSESPGVQRIMAVAAHITLADSEVIKVRWQRNGGVASNKITDKALTIVKVASGDIKEASQTTDDTSTNNTDDVLITDMTLTTPGDNDWLALFGSSLFWGVLGPHARTKFFFYANGSKDSESERGVRRDNSIDSIDRMKCIAGVVSPSTGDIQARWRAEDTDTRTLRQRTLVAIREASVVDDEEELHATLMVNG